MFILILIYELTHYFFSFSIPTTTKISNQIHENEKANL